MKETEDLDTGLQKPLQHQTQFRRVSERWSRTVIVGLIGILGLTALGIISIIYYQGDGATLGAIVAGVTSCVGAVAGRQPAPGAS